MLPTLWRGRETEREERESERVCVLGPHGQTETWLGDGQTESVVGAQRPGAVSSDRALCLPTFSFFVIVKKTDLSLLSLTPLSLSLSSLARAPAHLVRVALALVRALARPPAPCMCSFGAGAGRSSPLHSLHLRLRRWCWQMPAPPHSLHLLLWRWCWQMLGKSSPCRLLLCQADRIVVMRCRARPACARGTRHLCQSTQYDDTSFICSYRIKN